MDIHLTLKDLMEYTEWDRKNWRAWFPQQGERALSLSCGPHGDGRLGTVGEIVRHIFSAEMRYVQRLSGRPLTDTSSLPTTDSEALFQFGEQGRKELREFAESYPAEEWDKLQDLQIGPYSMKATPRKIVIHILMHEIRHWAQIATLLRMEGLKGEFHDFLFSPVLGPGRQG
jgi:uncharacterized damage-inducible protein DinB